jgi:hypothetical protein
MQARQGDIFFKTVNEVPSKAKPYNSNILAYGEVTGHSHKISSPSISEMESVVDEKGDIYVRSVKCDVIISHDEHNSITLPMGEWICVSRQKEFDPLSANRERQVAD